MRFISSRSWALKTVQDAKKKKLEQTDGCISWELASQTHGFYRSSLLDFQICFRVAKFILAVGTNLLCVVSVEILMNLAKTFLMKIRSRYLNHIYVSDVLCQINLWFWNLGVEVRWSGDRSLHNLNRRKCHLCLL